MTEPNLSWGSIIDKGSLDSITIPVNLAEEFKSISTSDKYLIVFTPRQQILKIDIFPIESSKVLKLQLKLTQFSGNTVKQIGKIIRDLDIPKNLFTSGVCFSSNMCIYEAYIEEEKLLIPVDELKERFGKVENVTEVIIQHIVEK